MKTSQFIHSILARFATDEHTAWSCDLHVMGIDCTADERQLTRAATSMMQRTLSHTHSSMRAAHGHNAEVVGECLCRVLAPQVLCPDSGRCKGAEEVAAVPCKVARPVAIKGDLHHRVLCTEGWACGR